MKNFTKQNFKTNPLWIRLLIMAFMLLAGAGNVWAANEYGMQYLYVDCKSFTSYTQVNADMYWGVNCSDKAEYKSPFPKCSNDNNVFYVDLKSLNSSSYTYYRAFEISQGSGWNDKKCFSVPANNKNNSIKISGWGAGSWSNFALTPSSVTLKVTSGTTGGTGTQNDPYLVEVGAQFTLSASNLTFSPADPVMVGRYNFGTSTTTTPTGTSTTSTQTASTTANTTKQYYVSVRGYYNGVYSSSYKTASVYVKTVASCTPPTLTLNKTSASVNKGETVNLTTLSGATVTSGTIEWSTSETGTPVISEEQKIDASKKYHARAVGDCKSSAQSFTVTALCTKDFYLVGSSTAIFGSEWSAAQVANKMNCDLNTLTKTYTNITVAANTTVEYKYTGANGWGDAEYPKSGNSSFTIPTAGTYNITFTATTEGTKITGTPTVTWELACTTVNAPNVTADAICAGNSATLKLTNRQEGVTYKLNSTSGTPIFTSGNDTYTTPVLNDNITYTIYASHDDACEDDVEGSVTVTVNPTPSFTTNPTDKTMCAGETSETNLTTLSGVVVANGSPVWYNAQTDGSTVAKADIVNGGTYWVAAENSTTGCKNTTRQKFVLTVNPTPSFTTNPTDKTMCAGETSETNLTTLSGVVVANGSPVWYNAQTGGSTVAKADIVNGGTYWVAAENSTTGCKNATRKKFVLAVKSAPTTPSLSADRDMLNTTNTTATLTIGNYVSGVTYTLYKGENSTGETTTETTFTVTDGGIYKVKGTNTNNPSACQDTEFSDGVTINVCDAVTTPTLSKQVNTDVCGNVTSAIITITNYNLFSNCTFTLNGNAVTPSNGKIEVNEAGTYTVIATNDCGNSSAPAQLTITETDNTPTISGPTSTLPGKANAIELTVPTGNDTKWTVNNNGDLSVATGASTMFSAEKVGEYTVTANYNGCTDTHIITVANGYTVYLRRPHAKDETTQYNYWFEKSTAAGPGYIKFGTVKATPSDAEMYVYNGGSGAETPGDLGTKGTESFTDCDGYVWDAYNIGIDVTALYFHAPNDKSTNGSTYGGYATYTRSYSQNTPISSDLYFTMGNWTSGKGRTLTKVEKPFEGIEIDALGSTEICSNNMASFAALYLKSNCTGQEITTYAWKYSTNNSSWGEYTTGKGANTNNIRPNKAGYYHLECKLKDGSVVTSNSIQIKTTTCSISNASLNNITSNLPIIMVNTGDKAFPSVDNGKHCSASADDLKKKRSVDVKILWNPSGTVSSSDAYTNGANLYYDRKARMNYRGSSSLNFEKKSYAFCPGDENCGDEEKGVDYVKTKKMNMFNIGTAEDKDWVLYAAYVDPSMMRNILAMETYAAMTGKWGVKNQYVELYVDGEYQGVYVFMDKITKNDNRVNIKWKIDKSDDSKSKREFILKFDKTDVADRYEDASGDQKTFESDMTGKTGINTYDTTVDQRFEIEYPEKEDIEEDYGKGSWSEVYSFVRGKVNEFEKALADGDFNKVRNLINYESWADFFILNEFTKNVDAYRASCVFVFKDGKFEAWPLWDYELSFNNTVTGSGKGRGETTGLLIEHSDVYSDTFPAPFWWTGKYKGSNIYAGLLKDPCFIQMVVSRWAEHTKTGGALHPNTTTTKTAAYKAKLDKNGAATREFTKWPVDSRGKDACNDKNTGYFKNGGGGSNTTYADSYDELNSWLGANARIKGLQTEIDNLAEIIEFGITATADKDETTPWRAVNVKVDAIGAGYTYTVTPAITGGQVIQGDGNLLIYAEETGEYTVVTTLDAKDQCGSTGDNASDTVTFTVNPLQEVCTQ